MRLELPAAPTEEVLSPQCLRIQGWEATWSSEKGICFDAKHDRDETRGTSLAITSMYTNSVHEVLRTWYIPDPFRVQGSVAASVQTCEIFHFEDGSTKTVQSYEAASLMSLLTGGINPSQFFSSNAVVDNRGTVRRQNAGVCTFQEARHAW